MKSRCVNIVVIVLSFPYLCAQAQDTLTVERNAVHIGDRVTSQALGISIVGNGGEGIIWDFSGADVYDNMRTYVYSGENEDSVIRVSRKSAETYVISCDSLLMVSEEDRLRRTDYLGNLVMTGGKPETYLFDGGYCSFDAAGHAVFHYYDRDHLGNVRAVVGDDGAVEQVMNYYPFGAPYCDETALNADLQPYKYNGKELETMHGRNAYDYGARFYDPLLPTWDRIDPLCEKYYHVSPYAYCLDNPVNAIDQEGQKVILYVTRLPMEKSNDIIKTAAQFATHTFLVVQTKSGSQHYYAFGSDRDGLLGAFSGKLSRQRYVQDLNVISDPTNDNLKRMITISPPQGMSSDEFDQAVINVAESYGNNEQFTYHLNPTTETTGNCNSSTSTVLYKARLSKEQIKNIGENIPGIKWGWGKTKPWTADEQEKAVQRQKGQEEHLDVLIENLYKGFK